MIGHERMGVAILGSTGSVGEHTLDVIARHPDRFREVALGANLNAAKLAELAVRFSLGATRITIADPVGVTTPSRTASSEARISEASW